MIKTYFRRNKITKIKKLLYYFISYIYINLLLVLSLLENSLFFNTKAMKFSFNLNTLFRK